MRVIFIRLPPDLGAPSACVGSGGREHSFVRSGGNNIARASQDRILQGRTVDSRPPLRAGSYGRGGKPRLISPGALPGGAGTLIDPARRYTQGGVDAGRIRGVQWTRKPSTSSSRARARPVARWPRACPKSGRYRVLLLEAGRRDNYPWIHIPIGYHKLYTHDDLQLEIRERAGRRPQRPHLLSAARQDARRHQLAQRHGLHARHARRLRRLAPARLRRAGTMPACCPTSARPRTRSAARTSSTASAGRSRSATAASAARSSTPIIEAAVQAGIPRNRRLQRRDPGGRRLLPGDRRQWPALERRDRLSEAGAQAGRTSSSRRTRTRPAS